MKVNVGIFINMEGKTFKDLLKRISHKTPGNVAIIVYFKNGNFTILGKMNFLGGVCDHSLTYFISEEIIGYKVITFTDDGKGIWNLK